MGPRTRVLYSKLGVIRWGRSDELYIRNLVVELVVDTRTILTSQDWGWILDDLVLAVKLFLGSTKDTRDLKLFMTTSWGTYTFLLLGQHSDMTQGNIVVQGVVESEKDYGDGRKEMIPWEYRRIPWEIVR